VQLNFTRPWKPTDNSHIESFNGRFRDECLNVHKFLSIGHLTPNEFTIHGQVHGPEPVGSL